MKAFQVFETLKEWEHYLVGKESVLYSIVLRPGPMAGPVRGPGFGFWRDHRVGRVNSLFLKKNQNDVILVKKENKSQQVCNRVSRVFPSPVFSSTRPGSSPRSTRRAEFQNYAIFYHEVMKF